MYAQPGATDAPPRYRPLTVPSRVEPVRSGDRPTGNTTATDQSAADPEGASKPEDIDADRSTTAVQPTGQQATAHPPAAGPAAAEPPRPEPEDGSPWAGDRPWPGDEAGPGQDWARGPAQGSGPGVAWSPGRAA